MALHGDWPVQAQLRLPEKIFVETDKRVKSRSNAIKVVISFYQEREKTREFFQDADETERGSRVTS